MIYELVYTSAPTGLFPGNTGFSVVGCTRNMDMALCKQLEKLSAYTPLYPHYDAKAWDNPVNFAHRTINSSGQTFHILSRICFNGVDYTNRSNKLASHLAVSENETQKLPSGPASIFLQPGLFKSENWRIQTAFFDGTPVLQDRGTKLQPCDTWKQIAGDAGWAGFIAESLMQNPQRTVYVVFSPEKSKQNLQLVVEVLNLLPPPKRWQLTFSTYFTELVPGTSCNLRFCLPGSTLLQNARQNQNANLVIDISRQAPAPSGGNLVEMARTGKLPEAAHVPLRPAGNAMQPIPQMPPVLQSTKQTAQIASKDNVMLKVAIAIMALFLLILAVSLLLTRSSDKQQIAQLEEKLKQNEEKLRLSEEKQKQCEDDINHSSEKLRLNEEKRKLSEERLKLSEEKLKQAEEKLKKAEDKLKQAEDKLKQAEAKNSKSETDKKKSEAVVPNLDQAKQIEGLKGNLEQKDKELTKTKEKLTQKENAWTAAYEQLCRELDEKVKKLPGDDVYGTIKKDYDDIVKLQPGAKRGRKVYDFIARIESEVNKLKEEVSSAEALLENVINMEKKEADKPVKHTSMEDFKKIKVLNKQRQTELRNLANSLKLPLEHAWSRRIDLVDTLAKSHNYELWLKGLEPDDEIKVIYDGKKEATLPAKIQLKENKCSIIPEKANEKYDWTQLKLSIMTKKGKWLFFFLNVEPKELGKGELQYQYNKKSNKLKLILPDCKTKSDTSIFLCRGNTKLLQMEKAKEGNDMVAIYTQLPEPEQGQEKMTTKERIEKHFKGTSLVLVGKGGWRQEIKVKSFIERQKK